MEILQNIFENIIHFRKHPQNIIKGGQVMHFIKFKMIYFCGGGKDKRIFKSLLTKSRNYQSLEMEVQPPHMTFMPHHRDFS